MERIRKSLEHQDEAICAVTAEVSYAKMPRIMAEEITFYDRDCAETDYLHTDALVISARIGLMKVHRILIDNGSSLSLLFKSAFDQMGLSEKDSLPYTSALQGFSGERKEPFVGDNAARGVRDEALKDHMAS